ncbi:MAG: hypothetical protein ACOYLB_06645 [Phototrophicaceae bacterium]
MFAEDRVLVGVINRRTDWNLLNQERVYRIPLEQQPNGIDVEYMAFYISKNAHAVYGGMIPFYARRLGVELKTRQEILPKEHNHPRAHHRYLCVQLAELRAKTPPILNSTARALAFIHTTWDRFETAHELKDLFRDDAHLSERIPYDVPTLFPQQQDSYADMQPVVRTSRIKRMRDGEWVASFQPMFIHTNKIMWEL